MRKLYFVAAVLLVAFTISLASKPLPFEERLVELQVQRANPELALSVADEPLEVKAVILDYEDNPILQLKAHAALLRYPHLVREILPLYGDEPEFQDILLLYGDSIFPPIHYFLHNEVLSLSVVHYARTRIDSMRDRWRSGTDTALPAAVREGVTPEQRGWYAIGFIREEGHDFVGQFVVGEDGAPQWIQSERFLEAATSFLAGGFRDLEVKLRSGQEVTGVDYGWAALDALVVVGTVKLVRMGRAATAAGRPMSLSTRTVALTSRVARSGKLHWLRHGTVPALLVTAYVVVTNPQLISDLLAATAALLGIPEFLGLFLGWSLILLPVFTIGYWLVRPAIAVLTGVATLLHTVTGRPG